MSDTGWCSACTSGGLRLAPCLPSPVCLACVSLARRGPRLPSSQLLVASPALRTRRGCPWWLTTLVPQGLGLGVSLLTALAVSSVFGSQRIFCPHGTSCLRLRTPSRSASPGSWAPLALVGPQPPPPPARPQPPQVPQRPRRRPRDALLDAHGLAPPPGGAAAAVAQPAHAAGASRRARDKRRGWLRKAANRSMWREI